MKDEVKTSSSIQQMANHLQSNSARGARVQRVDPPFWPRLGRFRFGCPGVGIAQQPPGGTGERQLELGTGRKREGRAEQSRAEQRGERQAGSMELWIAAYGSRKRVTVAKTVLVSPWLVLEVGGHYGEACLDWRLEHPRGVTLQSKSGTGFSFGKLCAKRTTYENRLSGWAVWLQLNSKWINPSDPDR
ncbi:uncharacterized protein BO88DRAFT_426348 [Aspergillus vadensis CBS 113365]|uniref:Uncharacterized protein n=1 Tax=Aspergillus vadensis (strain CBS 113365 / IMI 142717 / IBT 24658) TaxID=1448311 RepID=A0A319CIY6_ASPVC|nr:hypothetical protein BO88DRAFT_426348 [Aspergillus vadensis CBS 113365]PYH68242.1 hypothetical protein BO88DRAFT_426348 [Aspergillus vadensis CBS 113365]